MELSDDQKIFLDEWFLNKAVDTSEIECVFQKTEDKNGFLRVIEFMRQQRQNKYDERRMDSIVVSMDSLPRIVIEGTDMIKAYCKDEVGFLEKELEKSDSSRAIIIEKKTMIDSIKLEDYKVNVKDEKLMTSDHEEFQDIVDVVKNKWNKTEKTYRMRRRYSFVGDVLRIDLTVIKANHGIQKRQSIIKSRSFRESGTKEASEYFEMEVEYIGNYNGMTKSIEERKEDLNMFIEKIQQVIHARDMTWSYLSKERRENAEIQFAEIRSHSDKTDFFRHKYRLMPGPQVVSMNREKLAGMFSELENYTVTSKTDGLRMLGFVDSQGELLLLHQSPKKSFQGTGLYFTNSVGTILDGELVMGDEIHYLCFDCYYFLGKDVRMKSLDERLGYAKDMVIKPRGNKVKSFKFLVKPFLKLTKENVSKQMKRIFELSKGYENDGLIFTPQDPVGGYELYKSGKYPPKPGFIHESNKSWKKLLKWKDDKENTIDFRVIFGDKVTLYDEKTENMKTYMVMTLKVSGRGEFTLETYENQKNQKNQKNQRDKREEYEFLGTSDSDACITHVEVRENGKILCQNGDLIQDNAIIEMMYFPSNPSKMRWVPRNRRFDKTRPNSAEVAMDIWKIIHAPVTLDMIESGEVDVVTSLDEYYVHGTKIDVDDKKMRRFHTTVVKQNLIVSHGFTLPSQNPRLLDLASGRGGDLNRYIASSFKHIVGIDYALENLHNSSDGAWARLSEMTHIKGKDIVFLHGDVSKNIKNYDAFKDSADMYKKRARKEFENKFDMASILFAYHYMFKDFRTLREFTDNLDENLKIGGYFVGCCYDGSIVFDKLKPNGKIEFKKDGHEFLKIERMYSGDDKWFEDRGSLGKRIKVFVQTIGKCHEEYLVNFGFVKKYMESRGFECVYVKNFSEFYKPEIQLTKEEKDASFLNCAFAFKKVKDTRNVKKTKM